MFSYAVVDEGHQVFSVAQPGIDGQTRFKNAERVREVLESCLDPTHGRLLVFHDQDHQRAATDPQFPLGLVERRDALKYLVRITAAIRDVAMPFCRNLRLIQQDSSEGRAPVYRLVNEKIVGEPIDFVDVDVSGTTQAQFLNKGKYDKYVRFLHPSRAVDQAEVAAHDGAYAAAIAKHLDELAATYSCGASPFRQDLVAVLFSRPDPEALTALRDAVADKVLNPHVRQALLDCNPGPSGYRKDGLFWGAVENFIGMERPLVVVSGFRHPAFLLTKDPNEHSTRRLGAGGVHRIDPLLYQAITRCTYRLAIIEPAAKYFGRHYLIHRRDGAGPVPYSTDNELEARVPKDAFWDPEQSRVQFLTRASLAALQNASAELQSNWDFVHTAVQEDGIALGHAPAALCADRDIVLAAVEQNGLALQYAAAELRADRDMVLAAVRHDGWALLHATDELRADRDIVLAAVQQNIVWQNGTALRYAAAELRADRDFVLAAVRQDGLALQYATDELRADREIVLAAVQQNGRALQFASAELCANRDIVLAQAAHHEGGAVNATRSA
jgi:hypothetical protein